MPEPSDATTVAARTVAATRTPGAAPPLGEGMVPCPSTTPETANAPKLPPGRLIELPGRGTTFMREAVGPPGAPAVVLLHGWSVDADLNWYATYGPLAERYRVIAFDQRGHGRGIRPAGGVTLSDCADDVAALLDVLEIKRAVIVGYSLGGPIAQLVWRRQRDCVAGLVLCATAQDFSGGPGASVWFTSYGALGRVAAAFPGPARRIMGGLVTRKIEPGPGSRWMERELRQGDPAGLLSAMASLGRFRSTAWIGEVDVPVACVITTRDRTVPPSRQRRLAAAIPGATVYEVDGPHNVCATDPPRFLPAFLEACASVTSRL